MNIIIYNIQQTPTIQQTTTMRQTPTIQRVFPPCIHHNNNCTCISAEQQRCFERNNIQYILPRETNDSNT